MRERESERERETDREEERAGEHHPWFSSANYPLRSPPAGPSSVPPPPRPMRMRSELTPSPVQAVVIRENGPAENLLFETDFPTPTVADGQVLTRNPNPKPHPHPTRTRARAPTQP